MWCGGFGLVHLHRALELEINLRGIWKNDVSQLIRGVAENYLPCNFFSLFFVVLPQLKS